MSPTVKIEFISDISCVWCAIGLTSLTTAIAAIGSELVVDIHFQPFELNPNMPAGGQNLTEHIGQKYGSSPSSWATSRERIRQRGEDVGFTLNLNEDSRIFNTFDAHRLVHWARLEGKQVQFKRALFKAHLTEGLDPGDHGVLLTAVKASGLNADTAGSILNSDEYEAEVRNLERHWIREGVSAVPTLVINGGQKIEGSLPATSYEQLIREAVAMTKR